MANFIDSKLFSSPVSVDSSVCPVRLYALNDVTKLQNYRGRSLNIAVVCSTYPSVYMKIFYNGVFFKSIPISSTLFSSLGDTTAYLGRSQTTTAGIGLDAQFNEFRIYFGELSKSDVQSLYLIGTDPSHVTISSENTEADIFLTFYSTSLVDMNIQFNGGSPGPSNSSLNGVTTSFQYAMFGEETNFQLIPVNETCKYRPKFNLNPVTSSTRQKIPAMNYTITLLDNLLPAPEFSDTSCPSDYTQCYCGASKTPFDYMKAANLLNQSFSVTDVNTTLNIFQFYYRTGLCYEVIGSEQFSLVEGQANSEGDSCFVKDVFYMDKTDGSSLKSKNVTIKLFERYPEGVTWFTLNNPNKYVANKWTDIPRVNWFIENSTLTSLDQVSGSNSNAVIGYNTTLVKSCEQCRTVVTNGVIYTLRANYAFPSFPYDLKFYIYAKRSESDGTFTVDNTWYIPVLGVVGKEVPNYYPVSSDPNLIFLILRDPPGGTSNVVIKAGTTIKFGISIDDMVTSDTAITSYEKTTLGANAEFAIGFGFSTWFQAENTDNYEDSQVLKYSSVYGSTSTHDYSFSFQSDFGTSTDPTIAGHPSDVIIGGGVDIIVGEATQGKMFTYKYKLCCVYLFHPLFGSRHKRSW